VNTGKRGRDQTARVSKIEDNDGEKKYSPPGYDEVEWKSDRTIEVRGIKGTGNTNCPLLAPMMGSKPTPACLKLNAKAV